jgi:hypothetical protein
VLQIYNHTSHFRSFAYSKKKEKADKDKLFVCWSINIQAIPHDKWVKIRLVWQQFGKAKVMLTLKLATIFNLAIKILIFSIDPLKSFNFFHYRHFFPKCHQ